ncbi:MAG: pilus assembly protein N-terminal domain-containing protein [Bryobacterales bacterium]|nr:pilus assembly protein N-terminal domain-containing protein [Bryobacterales bacterium]
MIRALVFLAGLLLAAQTPPSNDLSITLGRGHLLQFGNDVTRVAISEPKIADAVVVSPREVMINAKGVGKATLVIWETGLAPVGYSITVTPDLTTLDDLRRDIGAALPGTPVVVTGNAETLVLTGSVKDSSQSKRAESLALTYAKRVVNLIEIPPPSEPKQILLQVKFASVDRVSLAELGFNYFSRNDKTLGSMTTQQFPGPRFSQFQFQQQDFQNSSLNFSDLLNLFIFRPDLNIGATIRALQSRNLLQILAEPNLIVIEGKEANFLAGGEFPFPTIQATTTGGATAPVVTVQFKRFGVELGFTPTITPQGAIQLKVAPSVTALDYSNAVTLQGFLIPAVSARRAETEVILKDGESFAVAGLLDNRVVQTISKIPWLGDVPILGNLFKSRSTRKANDELLVVVTPRFVKPVPAGETIQMPVPIEPFLPSSAEEAAGKNKKKGKQKPEFVGPRGHAEPKP